MADQIIWQQPGALKEDVGFMEAPIFDLWRRLDIEKYSNDPTTGHPDCNSVIFDHDFSFLSPILRLRLSMFALPGMNTSGGCLNLSHACGYRNASLIRAMCPTQCGCQNPRHGLYFSGAAQGCPMEKCVKSSTYRNELASLACVDLSTPESEAGWVRYWNQFRNANSDLYFVIGGVSPSVLSDLALHYGCPALFSDDLVSAFCYPSDQTGSLATFCPVTCGCRRNPDGFGCPRFCLQYERAYYQAVSMLPCEDVQPGLLRSYGNTSIYTEWVEATRWRFEGWKLDEVVRQTFPPQWKSLNHTSLKQLINRTGCDASVARFCDEAVGPYDINPICPVLCNCRFSVSQSCPTSCRA